MNRLSFISFRSYTASFRSQEKAALRHSVSSSWCLLPNRFNYSTIYHIGSISLELWANALKSAIITQTSHIFNWPFVCSRTPSLGTSISISIHCSPTYKVAFDSTLQPRSATIQACPLLLAISNRLWFIPGQGIAFISHIYTLDCCSLYWIILFYFY